MVRAQMKRRLRAFGISAIVFLMTGPIFGAIATTLLLTNLNVLGLILNLPIVYVLGIGPAVIAGLINFAITEYYVSKTNARPTPITGAIAGLIPPLILLATFAGKDFDHFIKGAWMFPVCILSGWACACISNRLAYNQGDLK